MERIEREDLALEIWKQYQNGIRYQESIGLRKNLPTFVRFFEGNQWPAPTDRTKNLPRPVVNITKMICRAKKAAILAVPVRLIYKTEDGEGLELFNRFASHIQKEIKQSEIDSDAIGSGAIKGCYINHYYWDSEAVGRDGIKEGGVRCELIDPLNIFFQNPQVCDEQKQEWIIVQSRESVRALRAKADSGVDERLICSDKAVSPYDEKEQDGDELCTVLTKYFRKNGEVYVVTSTKNCVVNAPRSIAPDVQAARREVGLIEDEPNNSLPDTEGMKALPKGVRAPLYPIVVGNYDKREKCIYGMGEVEGIIPNQKAINFNLAMELLDAQQNAWGKWVVKEDALRGQAITNAPGQVLIDYSKLGNGIQRVAGNGSTARGSALVDKLTQLTRAVTGSTEVVTGEIMSANISGAAIAQLQAQAAQPIEELKKQFWFAKEKQGRVLAQFFKLYYRDKEFTWIDDTTDQKSAVQHDVFHGADYEGKNIDVVVEATSGTRASIAGDINALETLFRSGAIDATAYIKAYPSDALSNKEELIKSLNERQEGSVRQLSEALEDAQKTIAAQQEVVNKVTSVIKENQELRIFIARLYTEAKEKISRSNKQLIKDGSTIAETTADAQYLAQEVAKNYKQNTQE